MMNEERKRDDEDEISITETTTSEVEGDDEEEIAPKYSWLWLRGVSNESAKSLFLTALLLIPATIISMCSVKMETIQMKDQHYSLSLSLVANTSQALLWDKGVQFALLMMTMDTIASTFLYLKYPRSLAMRLRPLFPSSKQKGFPGQAEGDVFATQTLISAMIAFFILIPMDVFGFQFGTSLMEGVYYDVAGLMFIISGYVLQIAVFATNAYAIPYVSNSAQPGHQVISTGLYRIVRHPMYLATLIFAVGCSMFFSSYLAMLSVNLLALAMVPRIQEEEKALMGYLEGYDKYCEQVKDRLIPRIW